MRTKNIIIDISKKTSNLLLENILNQLITNFNQILKRLETYEQKDIKQLREDKIKLEILFSTIADGVVLLDSELRILFANITAIKNLGWLNKSVIGTYIFDHLPIYINDQLLSALNDLIDNTYYNKSIQTTSELNISIQVNETKTFKFLLTMVLKQNDYSFKGITITIQDITRAIELNTVKNKLISNVSHELRTPLSNIRSFLETLYEYHDSLNRLQKLEFLKVANQETLRLTHFVNNMLDLSYLESQYNCIKDKINIRNAINYVAHTSQLTAKHKKINIIIESTLRLSPIIGNYNLLIQVISNLVGNAIKFTHKNSYVIIRAYDITEKLESYPFFKKNSALHKVRVEIIDEGTGISKINQEKIFQRFLRIYNNINNLKGKGLGLAIVQTIIHQHNSSINIYSEVHVGSCFWFDLSIITVKDT